jgi:hypothetical protein
MPGLPRRVELPDGIAGWNFWKAHWTRWQLKLKKVYALVVFREGMRGQCLKLGRQQAIPHLPLNLIGPLYSIG